jgi:hypothetical protein
LPQSPISAGFSQYGGQAPPIPPLPGGVLFQNPGGSLGRGPQLYYNSEIQRIGENAKKKVAKSVGQNWIMLEMGNEAQANGGTRYSSGKFTFTGKGETFAEAAGMGSDLDKAISADKKSFDKQGWKNISISVDVEVKYYVEPAPPGQNRSGKCVVQWRFVNNVTGTKNGVTRTVVGNGGLGGDGWFVDDNLKTTELADRPPG